MLQISFSNIPDASCRYTIYPIFSDLILSPTLHEIDTNNQHIISTAITNTQFKAKLGNFLSLPSLPNYKGILLLIGLGEQQTINNVINNFNHSNALNNALNAEFYEPINNKLVAQVGVTGAQINEHNALISELTCDLTSELSSKLTSELADEVDSKQLPSLSASNKLNFGSIEVEGAKLFNYLKNSKNSNISFMLNELTLNEGGAEILACAIASGATINSFDFSKYLTKQKIEDKPTPKTINFVVNNVDYACELFKQYEAIAAGNHLTRLVVSEPPNIIYPETMAQAALELTTFGIEVRILGEKEMTEQGFGALLAVGQGSIRDSQLVIMQWHGGPKDQAPIAIVGKGVTFDTGGINIKPSNGMEDMKYDMAGAGVVLGLMKTLAMRKAKVNVVGVMGLAENMPSGSAMRPSDIIRSLSGQMIEVLNTDAEGRLVLADALWYAQSEFKPQCIIDLATLTGAITVALGFEYAGLFANNYELAKQLQCAGSSVNEPLWILPMCKNYDKDIDTTVADVKNIGSGRGAGSSTAAQFLQRFIKNIPWAHLDIAGMAWEKGSNKVLTGKGATGFGVRLLNKFLKDNFES